MTPLWTPTAGITFPCLLAPPLARHYPYAGSSPYLMWDKAVQAVMQGDSIQQALRDLLTAQSHLMVSDSAYESLGQLRLGLTDQAPLR